MNKKTLNTAIFFTILYWLLVYFLVIKRKFLVKELNLAAVLVLILINLVIILCSGFLRPVFELVLKVTQKIGTLIFGLITTVVYFFILTPIALFKRLTGKQLMNVRIEKDKDSYYEAWELPGNIEKQY
ncbi:MAG: hypothetical protein JSV88_17590 [Candidatus Aminicenantes bacterium]|nr:MAG: hypothetical protein JSV88_17590 [Candidatus Aminicenantes bacterium]